MALFGQIDMELFRVRLIGGAMVLAFGLLLFGLWNIQLAAGERYEQDLARQSIRRIRLPGHRGCIYDRRGRRLADNRPGYGLAIYLEELRQPGAWSATIDHADMLVDRLAVLLGLPREIDRDDIRRHVQRRLPMPLVAWRDLDNQSLARWAEQLSGTPGIGIVVNSRREYPQGALASHLLGYVGRADPEEDSEQPYHYYIPENEGKDGLEKFWDDTLRGRAGGRLVRVDVSGYHHEELGSRAPQRGTDLRLGLDVDIQRLVEAALDDVRGAAVLLDPRNGDILAMASMPGFDPNVFIPAIPAAYWRELLEDSRKPLLNRAAAGSYPPGSIFKPVTALAAMSLAGFDPQHVYDCRGSFRLGRGSFGCWRPAGHGRLNLREAIKQSCNVYFYQMALECGVENIAAVSRELGLGRKTGIDLPFERGGIVPDDEWKRNRFGERWHRGDTCNLSIGQGALTVTPLQMAVVTAALANGGHIYRPRLVTARRRPDADEFEALPGKKNRRVRLPGAMREVITGGMRDAVMEPGGTARLARPSRWVAAAKTGTAEYGPKEEGRKYGWMIVFAPYEDPRYALAIIIEDAVSGGTTAGPRVRRILEGLQQIEERRNSGGGS